MLTGIALVDFMNWLYQEYGAKTETELILILQKKFMDEYLEVERDNIYTFLKDAHNSKMLRLKSDIRNMCKYYNENQHLIKETE